MFLPYVCSHAGIPPLPMLLRFRQYVLVPPPDFVEKDKTCGPKVVQDTGGFIHLDHECRLSQADVYQKRRPVVKILSTMPIVASPGWNKTTCLGHQYYQCSLAQKADLPDMLAR